MIVFLLCAALAFVATVAATSKAIVFLTNISMVGRDIQKMDKPEVPEMGGLPVMIGFLFGMLLYTAINTFYLRNLSYVDLLAAMLTVTLITIIGMLDDMTTLLRANVKYHKAKNLKDVKRVGFRQRHKFLLPLPAAVPLMAVMSGVSEVSIPFYGTLDIGVLYPLLVVPLAIFGASNATNMLAGMNGLEAGLGVILVGSLGLFSFLTSGSTIASAIAFLFAVALVGFLVFNRYPSRIFPGDSLTYTVGAVAACVAIIGNIEKFALFCFIPWFAEFVLKARSLFRAESFGMIQDDGTLKAPYEKVYSLTHAVMKAGQFREWQVTSAIVGVEAVVCAVGFVIFL